MASSSYAAAGRRATTLLDLPPELLGGHIIAALDAASRLALFRSSHALARLVLAHAPASKRLMHLVTSSSTGRWSPTLADLVGSRWHPLPSPLGLELRITSSAGYYDPKPPLPSRLPPATVRQHTTHLHLERWQLTAAGLATWQLHSPTLWPHLQHLTISNAGRVARPPTAASLRQLRPIPRLQSFSLADGAAPGVLEAVLPLAANAQRLRLADVDVGAAAELLQRLPRLTHAVVEDDDGDVAEALLQHPTVEHVTVRSLDALDEDEDLSQRPCRWKTLTLLEGLDVDYLAKVPVAQRLTVCGFLGAADDESGAGVAALQRLHAEGRLVLRPDREDDDAERMWLLPPGEQVFTLHAFLPALVRLVLEAGQGITCLVVGNSSLPISRWRAEVAPLLQQSGRITTLCADVRPDTPVEWCAGLLGALPPCIASVRADAASSNAQQLRALVQGGAASLTHPLTLTLVHTGGISAKLAGELRQMVSGGAGAGAGAASQQPLLTVEVVKRK